MSKATKNGRYTWCAPDEKATKSWRNKIWPGALPPEGEDARPRLIASDEFLGELRRIMAFYSNGELFLAPMLVTGDATLFPQLYPWFQQLGEEESRKRYRCWPLALQELPGPLEDIPAPELTLLSYLAPLKNKERHSFDSMPKHITRMFPYDRLLDSLGYLTGAGILEECGFEEFSFAKNGRGEKARQLMKEAVACAAFLLEAERWTYVAAEEIRSSRLYPGRALFSCKNKGREELPCPICRKLPNRKVSLPTHLVPLAPFHYRCGAGRPKYRMLVEEIS